MNVLLFGSAGYLGKYFLERYPEAICPRVDIADADAVATLLDEHRPDVVINAAGKTGRPNVDWCEDHKEETYRANVEGPLNIRKQCKERDIYFVHIGSGCIYRGDNGGAGYSEEDEPNFSGSYYSQTKIEADQALKDEPVLQLRLRMPFDGSGHDRCLLTKLSRYDRVHDMKNSVTYLPDFFDVAQKLIEKRATGIYNVVNPGVISPWEIMQLYKKIVQEDHAVELLSEAAMPATTKVARSNCRLSTEKLAREGIELPSIEERVEVALRRLAALQSAPVA